MTDPDNNSSSKTETLSDINAGIGAYRSFLEKAFEFVGHSGIANTLGWANVGFTIALEGVEVMSGYRSVGVKGAAEEATGLVGTLAGAYAGAKMGAYFGSTFGPKGVIGLGFLGTVIGAYAGEEVLEDLFWGKEKASLTSQDFAPYYGQDLDTIPGARVPVGQVSSARYPGQFGSIPVGYETNALDVLGDTGALRGFIGAGTNSGVDLHDAVRDPRDNPFNSRNPSSALSQDSQYGKEGGFGYRDFDRAHNSVNGFEGGNNGGGASNKENFCDGWANDNTLVEMDIIKQIPLNRLIYVNYVSYGCFLKH